MPECMEGANVGGEAMINNNMMLAGAWGHNNIVLECAGSKSSLFDRNPRIVTRHCRSTLSSGNCYYKAPKNFMQVECEFQFRAFIQFAPGCLLAKGTTRTMVQAWSSLFGLRVDHWNYYKFLNYSVRATLLWARELRQLKFRLNVWNPFNTSHAHATRSGYGCVLCICMKYDHL